MNDAIAQSLGDKLAGLDLTDDEATLLGYLIGGTPDDEVEGFAFDIEERGQTKIEWTYTRAQIAPRFLGPAAKGWSFGANNAG